MPIRSLKYKNDPTKPLEDQLKDLEKVLSGRPQAPPIEDTLAAATAALKAAAKLAPPIVACGNPKKPGRCFMIGCDYAPKQYASMEELDADIDAHVPSEDIRKARKEFNRTIYAKQTT